MSRQIATSSTTCSWMTVEEVLDRAEIPPAGRQVVRLVAEEADDVEAELGVVLELRRELLAELAGAEDEDVAPVVAAPARRSERRPDGDAGQRASPRAGLANSTIRYGRLTSGSWAR